MADTTGPAHRVQSAIVEYGFPQGHLGHLSASEEKTLKEFKALVIEKGMFKPASDTHEFGTHDDAMLLRFLRARRFNVQDALQQFKTTEDWRTANQIDTLYQTIDIDDYDATRRLYPQWTGRRDRRGIPVYLFEVKHLNSKTMSAYEKATAKTQSKAETDSKIPAKLLRLFALYENLTRFVMPLCTAMTDRQHPQTPITQSNNIVDISGVGLKQFWNLRSHMQDASQLATAHYPETLDRIFIIGAPAFFPTVWGWIKRWFDPITTSKIFILSHHDMQQTLRSFIEPANIPKKYGGDLDFEFGDMPVLDPAVEKVIQWKGSHKNFPHGPMFWVDRGENIELKAAGSLNGKERQESVCTLHTTYKHNTVNEKNTETQGEGKGQSKGIDGTEDSEATTSTDKTSLDGSSSVPTTGTGADSSTVASSTSEPLAVQSGETVSSKRPEPASFVTAAEGIKTLSLDGSATGPHETATANVLDPAVPQ